MEIKEQINNHIEMAEIILGTTSHVDGHGRPVLSENDSKVVTVQLLLAISKCLKELISSGE